MDIIIKFKKALSEQNRAKTLKIAFQENFFKKKTITYI